MLKQISLLITLAMTTTVIAATEKQKKMVQLIDSIAGVYESMYAPALWKKEFSNWTLAESVKTAKEQVLAQELATKDFHKIVKSLILSMKDYHVTISFFATESATLPFVVRGAEGRYFFVYINRDKLPKSEFPFNLGDELLALGDQSVDDIVKEIKSGFGGNTNVTDQALAEMYVTSRRASRAVDVPKGPVTLKIKKKDGKTTEHQLIWNYKPEMVNKNLPTNFDMPKKKFDVQMSSNIALELMQETQASNKFGIGRRSSYLPALGTKIWEADKQMHHDAYIYMNEDKELIGYIRIPTYGAGEKESKQFVKTMKKMNEVTDKLVIDQLNNPGGSVFYLYSLVSTLTNKSMHTPKHYMAMNQKTIIEAIKSLKELDAIKNSDDLKKAMGGETIGGYPVSMTFLSFMKSYYQFYLDEWAQGKTLTSPYHIYGVDKINPHPEVNYTKPILLLINELDFSGGDFFPAIMQDNKRATIMGVRTAGAGGYVLSGEIPNQFGVGSFAYTGSLADRVDNTPIENLGVTPEVDYSLTVKDFQNNFKPFADAINEQVKKLK